MSNYINKNDSSLSDGIGFIHTWIEIENPGSDPTYFSFLIVQSLVWWA
ncbi:hypothetical protein [Rahnella inusitata]|nr:hypothetical protein [Rahnella inusitata]QUT15101.1 hypothetical protein I2123_21090 [Rahnella inusitata]